MSKKIIFEVNLNEPVKLTQNLENFIKEVSDIKNEIIKNDILYSPGRYYQKSAPVVSPIKAKKPQKISPAQYGSSAAEP